jgi:hypothetical protein
MLTSWKIVFACQKGTRANAQAVYNELMHAALMYRYGKTGLAAVPVDDKSLTESIFSLTDHDKITTRFEGVERHITGKDLKELFIASILFKHIEEMPKYPDGTGLFVVLPAEVGSCDVGIIASKPTDVKPHGGDALRLSPDHDPYPLQIKEYYDHARNKEPTMTPKAVDVARLTKIVDGYEEYVLVLMRDFMDFKSDQLEQFFKEHPKVILISMPRQASLPFTNTEGKMEQVPLPAGKHNYLLTFPGNAFSVASFDWPPFLVPESRITGALRRIKH